MFLSNEYRIVEKTFGPNTTGTYFLLQQRFLFYFWKKVSSRYIYNSFEDAEMWLRDRIIDKQNQKKISRKEKYYIFHNNKLSPIE